MTERVESPTSATIADTSEQPATRGILRMLALMGPAFVAGAWQFGPGNLTTAVQAGSGYLYTLIWVIVVSTILMIFLTDMSVRLGIRSPISLIASIKDELGTWVGVLAGVGVFLITLCFSVGNAVGSGWGSRSWWETARHVECDRHDRRGCPLLSATSTRPSNGCSSSSSPSWRWPSCEHLCARPVECGRSGSFRRSRRVRCSSCARRHQPVVQCRVFTAYGTGEHARTERDYHYLTIADISGSSRPGS